MNEKTTLESGHHAEEAALHYLQRQGLKLITRNYRCRHGEIDLIMQDRDSVVFTEVRYRRNRHFGGAAVTVDRRKQDKLITSALHYLQQNRQAARAPARFDVIAIHAAPATAEPPYDIQWIKDAFQATF